MSKIDYIKQNWERIGVVIVGLITILCIGIMVFNLHKEAKVKELPYNILESKSMPSIISRAKYEELINKLSEPYIPEKAHIRNIFSKHQKERVETKPVRKKIEFKTPGERFKIIKIYKKPVELLFKGYMQLADGDYVATINWSGKTDFIKVGEDIRGYKLVDFKKDFIEQKTPWGGFDRVDKSLIVLERTTGEKLSLEIGHITLEKEMYAEILDYKEEQTHNVHVGSEFSGYKVLDISPIKAIIIDQYGVETCLSKTAH